MNTPHEPENQNDELLAAYRRASAQDARGPDPRVRERVLAQVRRDHAPAAANDSYWSWRAAAGIAVVGLVGLLVTHEFRTPDLQKAGHQPSAAANGVAARVADAPLLPAPPLPAPPQAAPPEASVASAPARRRMEAPQPTDSGLAADKILASSDYRAATRKAPIAADASSAVGSVAAPAAAMNAAEQRTEQHAELAVDREEQVRRAVRTRFAGLFLPEDSPRLNLVIALMNSRGQIDRAVVEWVAAGDMAAASEIVSGRFQKLNLPADQIGASGFIRVNAISTLAGEADRVLLVQYAWPRESER